LRGERKSLAQDHPPALTGEIEPRVWEALAASSLSSLGFGGPQNAGDDPYKALPARGLGDQLVPSRRREAVVFGPLLVFGKRPELSVELYYAGFDANGRINISDISGT
jgi:hypothetical protein